ncbi:MAG: DsbA family protein [bacterium]|nr:DsbA family protein [bacterium]
MEQQEQNKLSFWSFFEKNFLALSILVAGVMISGSFLYANNTSLKNGTANIPSGDQQGKVKVEVSIDDDPILGNERAKVTIVEFSDYQCPFCRTFWRDTLSQIKKEYINTNKVRFVYRDFPLSFHPMAGASAQAAECAGDQDKYWEMHDKIFGEQEKLGQGTVTYTIQDLKKWAGEIGLNRSAFDQCLDSEKYKDEVAKDFADGSAAGVSGTPSTFVNGRQLVGAQPFATFKAIIEEELKK